jgi:succinate dehydrogenase (ubiquinone) iron-sulfur subunit
MRRAAGALARAAREGAALRSARVTVATSARADAAAAAPAAAAAAHTKPPNVQEFKIYRWNPEAPGEKPYLKSYKARWRPAGARDARAEHAAAL